MPPSGQFRYKMRPHGRNLYMGSQIGWISVPRALMRFWAIRRYVQLYARGLIKLDTGRATLLDDEIKKAVIDFVNSMFPDTIYYWVCNWTLPHQGPCIFCQGVEERYRKSGAKIEDLIRIMDSQECRNWHLNSNLGQGVTYSRIMNYDEANSPSSPGRPPYGSPQTELSWDALGNILRDIIIAHEKETDMLADQIASNQIKTEAATRSTRGMDTSGANLVGV